MKKILYLIYIVNIVFGQANPVSISTEKTDIIRAGEIVNIRLTVSMDPGWHIYSIYKLSDGPISTKISANEDRIIDVVGNPIEPEPIREWDPGFDTYSYFHNSGSVFTLPIRVKSDLEVGTYIINVDFYYMVCNERMCFPPSTKSVSVPITIEKGVARSSKMNFELSTFSDTDNFSLDEAIERGLWSFILLSISMGFLALLTPCVFPMIPITVAFFTKQGESDTGPSPVAQASIYALGIISTFSILGIILAIILGASGANQLAANPWMNLFIGGLFVFFALSLFGMYEIQVPSFIRNLSLSKEQSHSGYLGILFMALTFTLTSFTCTVQFVGLLLVAASQGQWFWPILGMIIFSGAFATPFFFLALFPQYLARLPKSGSWLNSVKVVMGFLELAAAFKFFSNTDLVWGIDLFTYKSVLALWTIISLFISLYLLGVIRLPYDSKLESISIPRMLLSMFFMTFFIYLSTGLFGQKIHGLIESYLPPKIIQGIADNSDLKSSIDNDDYLWFNELESGFAAAALNNKPIFIDFTGYTCTNCRWMETNIFTLPEVKSRLKQYNLIALYTDGGKNHKENQQYEIDRFGTAALPYYVLLSPDDEIIATFPGLTRDAQKFVDFLDEGLIRNTNGSI